MTSSGYGLGIGKKKKKRTAVAATNLKYRDITEATTANMRTTAIGMHTMNTKPGQKRSDHYYGLLICIFFFLTAQHSSFHFHFSLLCVLTVVKRLINSQHARPFTPVSLKERTIRLGFDLDEVLAACLFIEICAGIRALQCKML